MKAQNFKLSIITALIVCFTVAAQAKTTDVALKADTSKMAKTKMDKMKKMDKMDDKMSKKKMAKKKMSKMKSTPSKM